MEKTSSKSSSRLCSRELVAFLQFVFLASGCTTYVRVNAPGVTQALPKGELDPKFCVVECTLEMHKHFAVFYGEESGFSTQKIHDIQPALQAASPDWFAIGQDAIPVSVKIRAEVTDYKSLNPVNCFPYLLTLGIVPATRSVSFDLSALLQVGPGVWSDGQSIAAKREHMCVNMISASSVASPEKGWREDKANLIESADATANQQAAILTPVGQFSIMQDLKGVNAPGGADPHFASILANEIVRAWQSLSHSDKQRVRHNPFAAKLKAQLYPETDVREASSNTGVAVPKPDVWTNLGANATPSVTGYGYNKISRKGYVEFSKNGVELLDALKWVRTTAIPRIAGEGSQIRIVSEQTLENGASRIDFEVHE